MATITGIENISEEQLKSQVARGGKFVMYQYCISILIMTFRQNTSIHYIAPGESGRLDSIMPTLVSFFLGWWGIPWGPIHTIGSIVNNLNGGKDVTHEVMLSFGLADPAITEEREIAKVRKAEKNGILLNRFLALVIDCLIVGAIGAIVIKFKLPIEIYLVLAFLYYFLFEVFFGGKTVGKMLLRIQIHKADSEDIPDTISLLIRAVVKSVSWMFPFLFLVLFFNKKQQSLHDFAAKTTVGAALA